VTDEAMQQLAATDNLDDLIEVVPSTMAPSFASIMWKTVEGFSLGVTIMGLFF